MNDATGFLWSSAGDAFLLPGCGGLPAPLGRRANSSPGLNHFWKKDFLSIEPALPLPGVGELGTFPMAPPTAMTCRGGVLGLSGLGRLLRLDKGNEFASRGESVDIEESAGENGVEKLAAGGPGP